MALGSPTDPAQPLDDERLRRIAVHAAVGLFEADCHGSLTFVTPKWRELTSLHGEGALGRAWLQSIHPEDIARVENAWNEAVANACALDVRYRAASTDGLILRTLLQPVFNEDHTLRGFAGTTLAVPPYADRVAEAMPQLVWVAAPDGTIQYFNQAWLEYTGLTVEAMQRNGAKSVVHPDDLGPTWERWTSALLTGEPYEIEYRLRNAADSRYRWFLARATPVRDARGNILHWVGTATEIDAQKRANANLRFVLEAGTTLASSYNVEAICNDLARLAVHRVADWCFIVLSTSRSVHTTAAIAHRDPERVRAIERFRHGNPIRPGGALDTAIRKNTALLLPTVSADDVRNAARDPEQLKALQFLQMRSVMVVPLSTAAGEVYGAITFVSSETGHTFTHEDLEVAEMVAERAAAAIHTAKAFDEQRRRTDQLRFIADASEIIFESFDLSGTFRRLTQFIVKDVADLAYILIAENHEALRTVAGAHRDPAKREIAERLCGQRTMQPQTEENALRMLASHRAVLHSSLPRDAILASTWEYLSADVRALDIRSGITVPLHSRGETFGALAVYRCGNASRPYDEQDLPLFEDLGHRLSIAIDHSGTLERERKIAEALQQTLLPKGDALPDGNGVKLAAEYRPSSNEADVGGDWYDALRLPDGSIAVSVGDVTGRGLSAAGLMGTLRQATAMAVFYETDPARVLDAVDYQLRVRGSGAIATAFIGIIDPERKTLRYASAGHPPPLLRRGGELVELRSDGLPLGLRDAHRESGQTASLEDAHLLLLYTDGLIEATRDVAFGERRLQEIASSQAILYIRDAARFVCEACLPLRAQDDTAVLSVSFGRRAHWAFDAENAQAAHDARSQFVARLSERALPGSDLEAAELIFGELIGNVVRHAPGPIEVQLEWTAEYPVLHVTDQGKGFIRNPVLPADPLSESGRGLYIISLLGRSVEVERVAGYGNHIAVELPVRGLPQESDSGHS